MINFSKNKLYEIKSLPIPAIIAISGYGGSGKSTAAELLSKELNAPIISIDYFFTDKNDYSNWDIIDFNRFKNEVIEPFYKNINPINFGTQMYGDNKISSSQEIYHNGIIIVEGIGLFRPEINEYFTYKIWIDIFIEEAVNRGKKRDIEVYNNPHDEEWEGIWKRNDLEYFEKYCPKDVADLIVNNV